MFDTDSIDSHEALGIGARRESRITERRVIICSSLELTNSYFTEALIDLGFGSPERIIKFNLGPTGEEFNYIFWHNRRSILTVENYQVE
jgi:hypothetical protein